MLVVHKVGGSHGTIGFLLGGLAGGSPLLRYERKNFAAARPAKRGQMHLCRHPSDMEPASACHPSVYYHPDHPSLPEAVLWEAAANAVLVDRLAFAEFYRKTPPIPELIFFHRLFSKLFLSFMIFTKCGYIICSSVI